MWDKLVFGDINEIVNMAYRTPHLIEEEHECNCKYCHEDSEEYECSVCHYDSDDRDKFERKWKLICPNCKSELMDTEDFRQFIECKRTAYVLPSKKATWSKE